MAIHGQKETSWVPRVVWIVLHLFLLGVAAWLAFGGGLSVVGGWVGQPWKAGDLARRVVLLSFGVFFFLRTFLTGVVLLKRKFGWEELGGVVLACAIYQVGFVLLGGREVAPLGILDYLGMTLFLLGSYLNTGSEWQRKKFKEDPANKGKLYTGGLFRLARHINYFGDIVWVTGWALVTHNLWSAIVPVLLALGFNFGFIPPLHKYLSERYGEAYEEWTQRSKKLIPFVY